MCFCSSFANTTASDTVSVVNMVVGPLVWPNKPSTKLGWDMASQALNHDVNGFFG
jgi:hypothetical protein